jgi:hypothetical protein
MTILGVLAAERTNMHSPSNNSTSGPLKLNATV